jgi:hypothetical protein
LYCANWSIIRLPYQTNQTYPTYPPYPPYVLAFAQA